MTLLLLLAGGHMFSGSYDKSVRVWDVHSLQCLSTLQGHSGAVRALAASSKRVFSGSDDTTIKVGLLVYAQGGMCGSSCKTARREIPEYDLRH